MIKRYLYIFFLLLVVLSCSPQSNDKDVKNKNQADQEKSDEIVNLKPLKFKDIQGRWVLKYSNNFGYDFRFYKSYKAIAILFLGNESLVFKGVYTIEENNKIRINIYEMKRERKISRINIYSGFGKAKSSHFIFNGNIKENKKKKRLIIKPIKVVIDGNNSEGYFEPVIKLKKM